MTQTPKAITPEQWFSCNIEIEADIEAQARREVEACASEGRLLDYAATVAYLRSQTHAPQLLAEAVELLRNAVYEDGEARVLTQDCEALQAAIAAAKGE